MQTKDISHNLSQFNCNLSTITTTTPPQPTTTTDKLNSSSSTSSSFLITDILSSNNNIDQIEHLTNTNLSSTNQINSAQKQQQQNNGDIESFIVQHEDNINDMMLMMTNTTHPIWQWLLDSFLSSLCTNESISRDEFFNKIKEKFSTTTNNVHNEEILSHFSLQLNKQLCQYQSIEPLNDSATFKLNIDSLKQLSHEFWRLFQETSLNNNNNNKDITELQPDCKPCNDNEQLNHSNELKLFWTKSYEQYFRHTLLGQLKQTEHSIVNNNNKNNDNHNNIHLKNKIKRKEQKTVDLNNKNIETIEQNDKSPSYHHHHHHQPFTWFFNPMLHGCLNTQEKLYNFYKTNFFCIKNYCKQMENLKINENLFINDTTTNNDNSSIINDTNDKTITNTTTTTNSNNNSNIVNNEVNDASVVSLPSNSALDALIHMTTSTMQQLKHDGDYSGDLLIIFFLLY
ncbi:unnamed protein product [Schistosoma turkestanicum]|nr:unnamed protein product [Schistosoma turkestanicum]